MMHRREDQGKARKPVFTAVLAAAVIASEGARAPASGQAEPEPLKGVLHLRVDDKSDAHGATSGSTNPECCPCRLATASGSKHG